MKRSFAIRAITPPEIPPNPPLSKTVTKFRLLAKALFGGISLYLGYVVLFKRYKKEDHWLIGPDVAPTTGGRIEPPASPSTVSSSKSD